MSTETPDQGKYSGQVDGQNEKLRTQQEQVMDAGHKIERLLADNAILFTRMKQLEDKLDKHLNCAANEWPIDPQDFTSREPTEVDDGTNPETE